MSKSNYYDPLRYYGDYLIKACPLCRILNRQCTPCKNAPARVTTLRTGNAGTSGDILDQQTISHIQILRRMKGQDDNPFDQQSVEEITAYKLTDGRLVTNLTDAKYEQDKINLLSYVEHLAMGTDMVSSSYEIIVDFFRENYTKLMLVYVQTIARQERNISQAMEELDGLDENQLFEKIGQEIAKGSPVYLQTCEHCVNGQLRNNDMCAECGGSGMKKDTPRDTNRVIVTLNEINLQIDRLKKRLTKETIEEITSEHLKFSSKEHSASTILEFLKQTINNI